MNKYSLSHTQWKCQYHIIFIPTYRQQYKRNLENNKTQALYRRIYRQKFMIAQRNKDSKLVQNK